MAVGFGKKTNNFISEYLIQIYESDLGKVATWLFENAKRMDKAMFFDSQNNWNEMLPVHVLTLRAVTPSGVFDSTSEAGYLTRVGGNPALTRLSEILFKDDYYFVSNLPEDLKKDLGPQLIQLIQMAYKKKIRLADSRVKTM